jgi:uroporphyrinogen-III synthase
MRVYTQSNVNHTIPDKAIWLPCISTQPVAHEPAQAQPVLITHIAALQHYQHALTELLTQPILCVGRHTAERLRGCGFETILCHLRAEEIEIHQPTTWLRGDHYARDFAVDAQITEIQTYRSTLNHLNIKKLLSADPHSIHVYSAAVLAQLQTRAWPHTELYTVPSAPAAKNLWRTVHQFDPSDAQNQTITH